MLEDSITTSPSKSNKSIHEARLIRKKKRMKLDDPVRIDKDHEVIAATGFLNNFYLDSSDDFSENEGNDRNATFLVAKPSVIIKNYKPFELEKTLALADHILVQNIEPKNFPKTQGFLNCSYLAEKQNEKEQNVSFKAKDKQNSSFSITESELINCVHRAEAVLQCATPVKQNYGNSKQDNLALVNSILEDFSQSPFNKDNNRINSPCQHTPEFRFRRRPVKTYSRKFLNTTKKNLNACFEEPIIGFREVIDDSDSCSSLSIQEDSGAVDEVVNKNSTSTSINNSQFLCDNLLNLSVYFTRNNQTQESLLDDSPIEEEENSNDLTLLTYDQESHSIFNNLPDLIKDVLHLRSLYPREIFHDSCSSLEDFYGFPDHNMNDSNFIDVNEGTKDQSVTHDLIPGITGIPDKMLQLEDNPILEEWNDDDCLDVFASVNTQNILYPEDVATNNEKPSASEVLNRYSIPDNCIGFTTAAAKPIKVSREAHLMAANILSNLPEIPNFEENKPNNCDTKTLKEAKDVNIFQKPDDFEWNDDCDLFVNFLTPLATKESYTVETKQKLNELQKEYGPSTSKMAAIGFKTAAGKNVPVSKKAQESVKKLLKEFETVEEDNLKCEEELKSFKCKVYAKSHNINSEQTSPKNISNIKNKDTHIVKENAEQSKLNFVNNSESSIQKTNRNKCEINNSVKEINCGELKASSPHSSINIPEICTSLALENNMGFQTANGKKVITSVKAQKTVEKLLEDFVNKDKDLNDLKTLRNNINKKNKNSKEGSEDNMPNKLKKSQGSENKEDYTNIILSEWPLENKEIELKLNNDDFQKEYNILSNNQNMGFQTAKGKKVTISAKAQKAVEKLLQDFNTDSNIEKYENEIVELKTKIQTKNKELKANNEHEKKEKSSQEFNEYDNIHLSEWPTSPENLTPKLATSKTKHSLDNLSSKAASSGTSLLSPAKVLKRGLHISKSSFAEQSIKSPSTSHSVIARKNLLSLTKRRQNKRNSLSRPQEEIPKINKELYDVNLNAATPIKKFISLGVTEQTPVTPNLKEFFSEAPLTSTPRINTATKSPQIIKDSDFKPISWQNNESISNKSTTNINHTTKLSETSSSNISLNSSNPTAKERIGRLKMYGKPPAVSPILLETHQNSRPLGLRRTRSMLKKPEK